MAVRAPCKANKTTIILDSHSEIFISQPSHSGGLCNGFGHLHHHLLHLCILRPCWVCPSQLLGSLHKANNIADDNHDGKNDVRLVLMVLDSWLMMAFAADEDEKGCYGRTEYYKRQFFQENEKEDCHRKKGSSIVIVIHRFPSLLPNANGLRALNTIITILEKIQ